MAPVMFRGKRADIRSTLMIREAERIGGPLRITQGAYNTSVSASAGTHAGGGVYDFSVRGLTRTQINRRVRALRTVGFAAWYRSPDEGPWPAHIHAVAVGCPDLDPSAERQVQALRRGRNGLRGDGKDRHRAMGVPVTTWEAYQAEQRRRREEQEDDEVKPEDIRAIAEAVWNIDIVPHNKPGARVNSNEPVDPDNPNWRPLSVIEDMENRLRVIEEKLDRLAGGRG